MSITRQRMLEEMGLTPQWVLRAAAADQVPAGTMLAADAPPAGEPSAQAAAHAPDQTAAQPQDAGPRAALADEAPGDRKQRIARLGWEDLHREIDGCRACGLCAQRKQAVPGVGDENAGWLFIGEGPGAEEDARGEPFVGQAGKLLDAMLESIGLARGRDVYIANAVKCRPPGNRTPEAGESAACLPFLERQIALIRPKLIVLLGRAAVQSVLGEDRSLASLRGKALSYRDGESEIPVLVTYHPAYLLRNLPDKAKAWEDLCRARAMMRALR